MERQRFVVDPQAGALAGDRWDGTGPTAVFLHAGVTDRRAWTPTIEALGGQVTAIAYDRRGFGETPPAESAFSHVDDLFAVLDDQGDSGPVWLVGNSAGGGIALEGTCREPDRIAGLVLIAPAVTGAPEFTLDPVEPTGLQPTRGEPVWDRLGEITQPVLVLCGSFDLPHLFVRSRDLAAALPGGRYEDLAGTARLPQVEQPDEVARRIAQVIN